MSPFDYAFLSLYIIGVFLIGIISSRRIKNQSDMFSAGGNAPWWASGLSSFMTMFSASTFVVWGGIAYKFGFVAVVINLCTGIAALLIGYFVAGKWNKLGISTPATYIQLRFGKIGLNFYTWTMMLKKVLGVAVSVYSLAIVLVALIPLEEGHILRDATTGNLSLYWAIIIFGTIVVAYTMIGGLWAVLMTDVLQFIVLTLVVIMVTALMINGLDDFQEVLYSLPDRFFSPIGGDYGWLFLMGWITINFIALGAEWAFVQRYTSVKTPSDAKKSAYLFGSLYLITPILWLFPVILYRGINPNANPEQAYILASQSVLPVGVLGLMFAAMFSATASMVSSQLNVFAGVLTNDFYKPFMNPDASESRLIKVGRFFTGTLGAILIIVALFVPLMGGAEKLIISINSLMVVPLLAPSLWGLFSKRIGVKEMCLVAIISFSVGLFLRYGLSISGGNIDVLVGVVLPVVILAIMDYLKRNGIDKGWVLVETQKNENTRKIEDAKTETKVVFDSFPQKVVMVSLLVCSISLFALIFLSEEGRGVIGIFGVCLLLIALGIHLKIKKLQSKIN